MHSDLHSNNWTLYVHVGQKPARDHIEFALYIVEDDAYRVNDPYYTSFLIDFSKTINADHGQILAHMGAPITEAFFALQRTRMMQIIVVLFPDFAAAHTSFLESALLTDFKLIMKAISAVDVMLLCDHMTTTFRDAAEWAASHESFIAFAKNCSKKAREVTLTLLIQVVKGELTLDSFAWPLTTLIQDIFADKKAQQGLTSAAERVHKGLPDVAGLTDVYNYKNSQEYDIAVYDKWGPVSLERAMEIQKKMEPDTNNPFLDCTRELFATGDGDLDKIVAEMSHEAPKNDESVFSDL